MTLAAIVLSANFVTLVGIVVGGATTVAVAVITQGRTTRELVKDVRDTQAREASEVKKTLDATHEQVRTSNGHTQGELIEKIDANLEAVGARVDKTHDDLHEHMDVDLEQLGTLNTTTARLEQKIDEHVTWSEARNAELQALREQRPPG